jgi:enolase
MKISYAYARQILDSRGNPTVEADVKLEDGSFGRAAVPSGASTGSREALELRDGDKSAYGGNGVGIAVNNVNGEIASAIKGLDASDQANIDKVLCEVDGTTEKSRLGANALLAVSLATAKAAAAAADIPLYKHVAMLAKNDALSLPRPMMNILNGGQHASESTDIQEFMIIPRADSISEAIRIGAETFHSLKSVLKEHNYTTTVGDEGGFAPSVKNSQEALDLIQTAAERCGHAFGESISLALDVAATELYKDRSYAFAHEGMELTNIELINWYKEIVDRYPIISIEDGLAEDDWDGWVQLTAALGNNIQLVGDDLLVTNQTILEKAIGMKAGNSILLKPNQIGTLSETINAWRTAREAGWSTILSHRSGETEDVTIAHLAVGLGTEYIKTGSLSRSDRVAKYNELIRIAEANPELTIQP